MLLTSYAYLAVISFLGISLYKAYKFARMPLHGRMELYPVPKEGSRGVYGGSYFEEVEWWHKPRRVSHGAEIKDMLKEMIFIKKLFENQRSLWWLSYSFHLGIYCLAVWTVLLAILAAVSLNGLNINPSGGLKLVLQLFTGLAGGGGLFLGLFGSCALFIRRSFDGSLRSYTTPQEYLNLLLIIAVLFTGIFAWGIDLTFARPLSVMKQILAFQPLVLSGVETLHLLLLGVMFMYIPLSKMGHYVAKYFTYHKVLWENEPNIVGGKIAKAVEETALYHPQTSWSAPHIQIDQVQLDGGKKITQG